jgi:hypothetical protein
LKVNSLTLTTISLKNAASRPASVTADLSRIAKATSSAWRGLPRFYGCDAWLGLGGRFTSYLRRRRHVDRHYPDRSNGGSTPRPDDPDLGYDCRARTVPHQRRAKGYRPDNSSEPVPRRADRARFRHRPGLMQTLSKL